MSGINKQALAVFSADLLKMGKWNSNYKFEHFEGTVSQTTKDNAKTILETLYGVGKGDINGDNVVDLKDLFDATRNANCKDGEYWGNNNKVTNSDIMFMGQQVQNKINAITTAESEKTNYRIDEHGRILNSYGKEITKVKEKQAAMAELLEAAFLQSVPKLGKNRAYTNQAHTAHVVAVQEFLVEKGYLPDNEDANGIIAMDGDYGPATRAAVLKYQQDKGLFADGIAGHQTLAAMCLDSPHMLQELKSSPVNTGSAGS